MFDRCLDVTRDMIASVFIIKRIEWLKTSAALKCFKTDKHNFRANTIHRFLHIMTKNPRALIASLSWLSSSLIDKKLLNIASYLPISLFVSRNLFLSLRLWWPAATPFRRFCIHQTQRPQRFQTQDLPLLTSTLPSCQQITRLVQRSDGDKFANKYLAASRQIHEMIKVFLVISGHFDFSADHGRAGTYSFYQSSKDIPSP